MSNIGIFDPRTRWKGNFMECTLTMHPTIMMNGMKKNRGRDKPKKSEGTR